MGWTPPFFAQNCALVFIGVGIRSSKKESDMNATTVAVDLAKSVFQLAVADASWRVVETQRLTRTQFERWF
jgi:transposase